jgi:O-acetylhomoserine (thiol)-lyase
MNYAALFLSRSGPYILFSRIASIGDVRSWIFYPAITTHRQVPDEKKAGSEAGPDVVRLSVGIEDVADIIADLEQALAGV